MVPAAAVPERAATALAVPAIVLQGPLGSGVLERLAEALPVLVRAAWFAGGFLVVAVVGWFVVAPAVAAVVRKRNRNNPTIDEAVARYLRLVVFLLAVAVGAVVAGFTQFLTNSAIVVAAATLALGVAAQSVIGSLVSGSVLVLDPEFNVGDYVVWAEGEGTIRSITLRVTRVQTPAGELVTVPNEVLTNQAITRPYGHGRAQLVERVGVAYDDDLDAVLDHLEAAAAEVEGILEAPSPHAYVDELGAEVVVRVHFWIADPDREAELAVRCAYARAVKRRLDDAGVTLAPAPQRELGGRLEVVGRTELAGRVDVADAE